MGVLCALSVGIEGLIRSLRRAYLSDRRSILRPRHRKVVQFERQRWGAFSLEVSNNPTSRLAGEPFVHHYVLDIAFFDLAEAELIGEVRTCIVFILAQALNLLLPPPELLFKPLLEILVLAHEELQILFHRLKSNRLS